jgi:hypothetical protein
MPGRGIIKIVIDVSEPEFFARRKSNGNEV